jgi:hemoglobin
VSELPDIHDRDDLIDLLRAFYARAFEDDLLGPVFVDVAQLDLEAHLPTICDFWATILLGDRSYRGGAFAPHVRLHQQVELTRAHFDRWVELFTLTVTERHAGEVADVAVAHANRVADAFSARLNGYGPLQIR